MNSKKVLLSFVLAALGGDPTMFSQPRSWTYVRYKFLSVTKF